MLVYNNQIENMRLRNRLYEMQYSKQEQAEHKQAQDEAETLGALNRRLREQQSAMTPSAVGGGTPSGGQTPVGANPMSTEGPTRMAAISQRLKGVGMTDDQIAGSLGGLSMETAGFDPNTVNPKSGAFGIGQWLGDRLQNLKQYAAYNNKPINDFGTQLDFLESELRWGQKGSLQAILNAKTRPDVVNAWTDKFEVSDATPALREKGVKFANNMNVGNMTADTSGKTVPPSPTGMAYQGQQQQQQPKQYGSIAEARGDLFAQEYLEKQQADVQQQQQQILNNSAPILTELIAQYSKKGDNKGKDAALDGISGLYAGKPNADLVNQRIAELRKVDVSGPAGTFAFEGEVTPATLSLAKDLRVPPQIMAGLQGRLGQYLNMKVENSQVKEWKTERTKEPGSEGKNKTKEQLAHDALKEKLGKEPTADQVLEKMKEYDVTVAGAKTGATETARREAAQKDPNTFANWPEDRRKTQYEIVLHGGKPPQFAWRDAESRNAFSAGYAQYVQDKYESAGGAKSETEKAVFASDKGSLNAVTKGMDAIKGFEVGADQSMDLLAKVADDYDRGQYPKANEWKQIFAYHTGDPDIRAFQNVLVTSATEYVKVINAGSNLTAAELSVMGQQRAKEMISTADTPQQLKNEIDKMKQEMAISGGKLEQQRESIVKRMETGIRETGGKPSGESKPDYTFNPKTGRLEKNAD